PGYNFSGPAYSGQSFGGYTYQPPVRQEMVIPGWGASGNAGTGDTYSARARAQAWPAVAVPADSPLLTVRPDGTRSAAGEADRPATERPAAEQGATWQPPTPTQNYTPCPPPGR